MKECSTLFRRTQKEESVLSKKRYIMALLCIIKGLYAQIELENAEKIQEMRFGDGHLAIHSEGSLYPLRGYLLDRCKYMQNMRMYLSDDDIKYNPKRSNQPTNNNYIDACIKKPLNGIACASEDDKKSEYLWKFTQQMITMFPTEGEHLSIESDSPDSFTQFLREHRDRPDSLYALAALFLLAEGVNIPIKIVNESGNTGDKILVLKQKGAESGFHVNLNMAIKDKTEDGTIAGTVYQKKTEDLVNFFSSLTNTELFSFLEVPEEFLMPNTYEEFLTGNFLNSPKFLIQAYFFEYIDSVKMYEEFVRAVHELLTEKMSNSDESGNPSIETENKAQQVFDSLFIKETLLQPNLNYIADISKLKEAGKMCMCIPFMSGMRPSRYTHIPPYYRSKDALETDRDLYYPNIMETILLSLFCCFVFDPVTKKYTTDHIPGASKDLQEFFRKYNAPTIEIDYLMQRNWSRVVSDLPCKRIKYSRKNNNEIMPGVTNMLYVISEITGRNADIESAIACLEKICNDEESSNFECSKIKNLLQKAFEYLSKNKNVEVSLREFEVMQSSLGYNELFVTKKDPIELLYTFNNMKGEITLEIGCMYPEAFTTVSVNYYTTELESKLIQMKERRSNASTYMECLVLQYASIKLIQLSRAMGKYYDFTTEMPSDICSWYNNPTSLLLYGSLENIEKKSYIVEMFLIYSNGETLDCQNPMVRFTSNLIRSVPLEDPDVRKLILKGCLYNEKYRQYYPWLEYDVDTVPKGELFSNDIQLLFKSITELNLPESMVIKSFISLLRVYGRDRNIFYSLTEDWVFLNIIDKLHKDFLAIEYLDPNELKAPIENNMANTLGTVFYALNKYVVFSCDYTISDVYVCWFVYLCSKYKLAIYLVMPIYTSIDHTSISNRVETIIPSIFSKDQLSNALSSLKRIECILIGSNDPESQIKYNALKELFEKHAPCISLSISKTLGRLTTYKMLGYI
ncbi:hypothetical protein NEPAR08_0504 [Nematocida parisii]|uniref:Uncharacterized protein n=1 Tax=Nematocida parisii (strain ERTm3) TaxID=935791 RepID=I3EDA3_NEMP3|nr:hypothetical protein NEQG_02535 [Nematocida parisii ERTm3]KAI5126585.1 hypothetical protein NEPAR08_0504 [Nematocida parisii]KAI5129388.1 hypothetical protein NEPAR03_1646 [Nematocida parisii]KAI5145992.1 hypothetical protein NEPAR07_2018 [Nematocida parisii]